MSFILVEVVLFDFEIEDYREQKPDERVDCRTSDGNNSTNIGNKYSQYITPYDHTKCYFLVLVGGHFLFWTALHKRPVTVFGR